MSELSLRQKISEDMKSAMKAKDSHRLSVIRLIQAAIKQFEVDNRKSVEESDIFTLLNKMVKQRNDSIAQYTAAKRQDLADQESSEVKIIQEYLPQPLTQAEIEELVKGALCSTGASQVGDLGKVMAILKPQLQGRADLSIVSQQVKSHLVNIG